MISIIALLLLFFAGCAIAVGVVIVAIATKKLWIIPAAGGIVFLGLMACGLLGWLYLRAEHRVATEPAQVFDEVSGLTHALVSGPPNFNASQSVNRSVFVSGPTWRGLMFGGLMVALVVVSIRRLMSPTCGHGFRRAWPVAAAILLITLLFLGTVRTQYTVSQTSNFEAAAASRHAAEEAVARQRDIIASHKQVVDRVRMQKQLVQSDIRAEMEQFDAPRIPLRASATSAKAPDAPPAPTPPAAPAKAEAVAVLVDASSAKINKNEPKEQAASSNKRRKKTDKSPPTNETQRSHSVAETKTAEKPTAKKESASPNEKPVASAEAMPERSTTRPPWIDEPPNRMGNTRREVVATEQYESEDECYQAADIYLLLKTYQRMQQFSGQPHTDGPLPSLTFRDGQVFAEGQLIAFGNQNPQWVDYRLRTLRKSGIDVEYVRREIVAKDPKTNESREFVETVERSFGPMKKLYVQIEFTPAIDAELRRHWQAYVRQERFAMFGVGAGSLLGILGLAFATLKIDTATKGYYSKRLFIGVPLAILGMFGLYAMLVEMGVRLPH